MKLIKAIIKPFKLEEVKDALIQIGVKGMTVTEVRGFGQQKGNTDPTPHGNQYFGEFIPKLMLEIAVPDVLVSRTVNTLMKVAKTGKIGDGKIFVLPMEEAVRIRTEDRGEEVL